MVPFPTYCRPHRQHHLLVVRLMTDSVSPAHVRVTAATALLRFGTEGIELDDLAARVEQLEQAAGNDAKVGLGGHRVA